MNSQPTLFLNLTGSTSNGSKPATSKWIWLLIATVLYYSSKTIIHHSPRVAFFANHHVTGNPFEDHVSSHIEDNLKLFNRHFEVHGPRGSPHKLVRRSPQDPGPVAQVQNADVVDLTLGDSPLVINVEDEEDGIVHVSSSLQRTPLGVSEFNLNLYEHANELMRVSSLWGDHSLMRTMEKA
ncbi:hypothetical protein VP01_2598g2 [Puccinia sorghi]|uniref:Uncharacterized protein n=1 Tax=Puccinia sorghi TaxID=27349 RepID=A0A0L6V4N7_9BASI|nr:hypothetical protein VP01_2598g2 [Puccinia sorghi]